MSKLTSYILIMSGLLILFYFAGLLPSDVAFTSNFLKLLLDPNSIASSSLLTKVIDITSAVVLSASFISLFFITNLVTVRRAGFILFMIALFWDFSVVVMSVWKANPVLTMLFFSPILIIYIFVIFEFLNEGRS